MAGLPVHLHRSAIQSHARLRSPRGHLPIKSANIVSTRFQSAGFTMLVFSLTFLTCGEDLNRFVAFAV